jgi:hypothetical protein
MTDTATARGGAFISRAILCRTRLATALTSALKSHDTEKGNMKNTSTAAGGVLAGAMSTTRLSRKARFCLAGALSAIAALPLIVAAAPAQAALSDCEARHVCVWEGPNYSGRMFSVDGYQKYTDLPEFVHDKVRSAASMNRGRRMCLIDWVNGRWESRLVLDPGTRYPNLNMTGRSGPDAVNWC